VYLWQETSKLSVFFATIIIIIVIVVDGFTFFSSLFVFSLSLHLRTQNSGFSPSIFLSFPSLNHLQIFIRFFSLFFFCYTASVSPSFLLLLNTVSSTSVRTALKENDEERAEMMLGKGVFNFIRERGIYDCKQGRKL